MAISAAHPQPSKLLNISLWTVQILLAAFFGGVGFFKLTAPIPDLAKDVIWPGEVPELLVRFIGASELAGALGLILPSLTRILPRLTPVAAACLVLVMGLAMGFHIQRGELFVLPFNVVLALLASFVAWGRTVPAPLAAR